MVESRATYEGDLRVRAVHGPSGVELLTDAPVDNHGQGRSFSPTDLVGTAIATCMLTIMGLAAKQHGLGIEGATCAVEKQMIADPRRRIASLDVKLDIPGSHDERARRILEQAARGCPVTQSLDPRIEVRVEFSWSG